MEHEVHIMVITLKSGWTVLSLEPDCERIERARLWKNWKQGKGVWTYLEGIGEPLMYYIESSDTEGRLVQRYSSSHLQQ